MTSSRVNVGDAKPFEALSICCPTSALGSQTELCAGAAPVHNHSTGAPVFKMRNSLERPEEVEDGLFIRRRECLESFGHLSRLGNACDPEPIELLSGRAERTRAVVLQNRRQQPTIGGSRATVMQEEDSLPYAPQGRRAELIETRSALVDEVREPEAHVMERDIRERVEVGVSHPGEWRRRGVQGSGVAQDASDSGVAHVRSEEERSAGL